jgi:MoxR-like ATPase
MNIKNTFLAIDALFAANITPHLIGKHGIGKSAIVYQYGSSRDYDVVEIRVGLMADAGDLVGIQEFIRNKQTGEATSTRHVLPEWFMKAVAQIEDSAGKGRRVIIFLDEMNRGHKDILQAIFELVYDRSLKGVKMAPGCQVIAASNPPTKDYSTIDFSDEAFQDRFCHIKVDPTVEEWLSFMRETSPESSVADFIMAYPKMLENDQLEDFKLDFVKPSRRSWDRITKLEKVGVNSEVELEVFMGIVGEHGALSYRQFRASNFLSIKAEEVLNNYDSVRNKVLTAIEKRKTDLLGALNDDLDKLIKAQTSLSMEQADNLAKLANDLPAEHAYTLGIIIKSNSGITMKIDNPEASKFVPGFDHLGMFGHAKFVEKITAIKAQRNEMKGTTETVTP